MHSKLCNSRQSSCLISSVVVFLVENSHISTSRLSRICSCAFKLVNQRLSMIVDAVFCLAECDEQFNHVFGSRSNRMMLDRLFWSRRFIFEPCAMKQLGDRIFERTPKFIMSSSRASTRRHLLSCLAMVGTARIHLTQRRILVRAHLLHFLLCSPSSKIESSSP